MFSHSPSLNGLNLMPYIFQKLLELACPTLTSCRYNIAIWLLLNAKVTFSQGGATDIQKQAFGSWTTN